MSIATLAFWKATGERAVKTVAQSAVALITANATGLLDVDYLGVASVAGLAGVVSILTSIGSDAVTGSGPSLTPAATSALVKDRVLVAQSQLTPSEQLADQDAAVQRLGKHIA